MRIGLVCNGDAEVTAAALRPLLPPGTTLAALTLAATEVEVRAGRLGVLIIVADGPDWRRYANCLTSLRVANGDHRMSVLALVPRADPAALPTAFELGVADAAGLPMDPHEVRARLASVLRRQQRAVARAAETRAAWRLAVVDPVTGLHNRHHLDAMLPAAVASARARQRPLALLMIDVDDLKLFNDRWGHVAGDRALRVIADALKSGLRLTDSIARIGGDEIAVVLPDTDGADAAALAAQLRARVETTPVVIDGQRQWLTVSIGVSALTDSADVQCLLSRADGALYAAKRSGRNRVRDIAAG